MTQGQHRYYSQNGEDFLLWNLFGTDAAGFYVDVGAFDGVHLSNTYSFEQQGWSGICLEPHPFFYPLCRDARPGSICLNVACVGSEDVKTVEFYTETLGLLSGIAAKDHADDIRRRYESRGLQFSGGRTEQVPASTLNAVLARHLPPGRRVDFLSIDVEGTEMDVLRGLDLGRYSPRAIVLEVQRGKPCDDFDNYLAAGGGYVRARRLGENAFYARDKADIARLRSVAVNCRIEKTVHPLGEKYTLSDHLRGKEVRQQSLLSRLVACVAGRRGLFGRERRQEHGREA